MKKDQWIVGLNSKYGTPHNQIKKDGFRIPSDLFPLSTNPQIVTKATSHITYNKPPTQQTPKFTTWAASNKSTISKQALNSLIQPSHPPINKQALIGLVQPVQQNVVQTVETTVHDEYIQQPTSNFPQKPVVEYWHADQNRSRIDIQPHPPRLTWWQQITSRFPFLSWKCLLVTLLLLLLLATIAYLLNRKQVIVQYVPKPVTIVKEPNPFQGHPELTCPQPYFLLNNMCIKCPKDSQWNGKICVVPPKIKKPVPVFIAKVITNSSGQFVVSNTTVNGEKGFISPGLDHPQAHKRFPHPD